MNIINLLLLIALLALIIHMIIRSYMVKVLKTKGKERIYVNWFSIELRIKEFIQIIRIETNDKEKQKYQGYLRIFWTTGLIGISAFVLLMIIVRS